MIRLKQSGDYMDKARFTMIDEEFKCTNCGKLVKPLGYSARDHCPYCLCSIHVDNNPGDRECTCKGLLVPINIEKGKKDTYKIVYKCNKCNMINDYKEVIEKHDKYNNDIKKDIDNELKSIKKYDKIKIEW